uniref:RNA-directed DNA polymerase n=1 Tax=Strongyloides stercoralis TaxID=6248 RepID=A0AAF5DPY6_STRER
FEIVLRVSKLSKNLGVLGHQSHTRQISKLELLENCEEFVNKSEFEQARLREIWVTLETVSEGLEERELLDLTLAAIPFYTDNNKKKIEVVKNLLDIYKLGINRSIVDDSKIDDSEFDDMSITGMATGSSWRSIEIFDTRSGKSFKKWIEILNDYFIVDNLTDDGAKKAAMRTRLDEEAREFLKANPENVTGTYEQCVALLCEKYNGEKAKEAACMRARVYRIDMREEKIYESIVAYGELLATTSDLKGEELLRYQINMVHDKLEPYYELWNKLLNNNKYHSLIECAADMEATWKLISQRRGERKISLRSDNKRDKNSRERRFSQGDKLPITTVRCFNCNQTGHYKNKCPLSTGERSKVNSKRADISVENQVSDKDIIMETNKMLKLMLENQVFNRGYVIGSNKFDKYKCDDIQVIDKVIDKGDVIKEKVKDIDINKSDEIDTILRTAKKPYEFYIAIECIDGMMLTGLIDTGATRSIMKKSTAMRCGYKDKEECKTKIVLADGTIRKALGDLETEITIIPGIKVKCLVAVVNDDELKDDRYSMIVGSDILRATAAILNFGNQTILMCGREVPHVSEKKKEPMVKLQAIKAEDDAETYISELKEEFKDIISQGKNDLGECTIMAPEFELTDKEPPKIPRYPTPFSKREAIMDQIKAWKESNVIVEDKFVKWIMNIVLVPKPDGSDRICLDSRPLNSRLIGFDYKTPTLKDKANILNGATYYTTLDLVQYFNQIKVTEESSKYLGFRAPDNTTYRFVRLPFGIKHATAISQRIIDLVLQNIESAFSYVDDICIATKGDLKQHFERVKQVMDRLRQHKLKINFSKCQFACKEIQYLGFLFSKEGQVPSPIAVEAILCFPRPRNLKSLRRFLGKVNFYRSHIPNLAKLEVVLTNLLKKEKTHFLWDKECEKSFSQIKKQLVRACKLNLPDESKEYIIHCDASADSYAAALMQESSTGLKPIGFYSKRLTDRKTTIPAIELELRCLASSLSYFRQWIFGKKVLVLTDHRPLKQVVEKNCERHLLRFIRIIKEYDVEIEYLPGSRNVVADCLSRAYLRRTNIEQVSESSEEDEEQEADVEEFVEVDQTQQKAPDESKVKRNLTEEEKVEYMEAVHTNLGHGCFRKCFPLLSKRVYWKEMCNDLKNFISRCPNCLKRNPVYKAKLPYKIIEASYPLERISVDVMGPFKRSENENCHVLGVVDILSKYIILEPMVDCKAETIAKTLKNCLFYRIAIPKEIKTDNAKYFVSGVVKDVMDEFGVKLVHSTAMHHEGSSIIERVFRSVQNMIAKLIKDNDYLRWDELLKPAAYFYNQQVHCTTGRSPHSIMFGWNAPLTIDLKKEEDLSYIVEYNSDLLERKASFEITRKIIQAERKHLNQKHNLESKEPTRVKDIRDGTYVYIKKPVIGPDVVGKFTSQWREGYRVLRREGDCFWVTKGRGRPMKVFMDYVKIDTGKDSQFHHFFNLIACFYNFVFLGFEIVLRVSKLSKNLGVLGNGCAVCTCIGQKQNIFSEFKNIKKIYII